MDPIVIKIQVEVVPAEEISHLQLRNAKLQEKYEQLDTMVESLSNRYSQLLYFFSVMKREFRNRD